VERQALLSFLVGIQEEHGGAIPVERFMKEALYHPEFGYYTAHIRDVGPRGDFSTSATLGEELGTAIARWIEDRIRGLGLDGWSRGFKRIPLIEIGAGNGSLARTILKNLDWRIAWRVDYMIHETSPTLRRIQKKNLRWNRVRWVSSLAGALEKTEGKALMFSNELVDAFPCRVFERGEQSWSEIGIRISPDGGLSEVHLPISADLPDLDHFSHLSRGQRVEVHESYRSWLKTWSDLWKSGALLTIDYGDTADRLYVRRLSGSLRGYWNHERITGPHVYARFGKQDLTADVNFTDLIRWGEASDWKTLSLETQGEFLNRWLDSQGITLRHHDLNGANDSFRILEQRPLPRAMS
jgi:SAM-dependent MidA family methyltransferase